MNIDINTVATKPPKLFTTIGKGFNIVASRIYLILIPVLVDVVLWLGPKLRIKSLFMPDLTKLTSDMLKISPDELVETVKTMNTMWGALLEQFNLFVVIRTVPVGVPSLIARQTSIVSPLKYKTLLEIPSLQIGMTILGALLFVGFFLGAVYFNFLSRYSNPEPEKFEWKRLFSQYGQSLLLFVILLAIAVALTIPLFLIISVFTLISPGIGQFVFMGALFLGLWLLVPLAFSPHAIFTLDLKAFPSMLLSMRMVRFFLPGTGLFVVVSALISEGMNYLWTVPGSDSWLTLVGIGGHAFIVTALLAASFTYFREGLGWMKFNIQKMVEMKNQQENGGTSVER